MVVQLVCCSGGRTARVALDAEQEVGRDQQRLERVLNTVVEIAAALPVEVQERPDIRIRDRTAEGAMRETGEDVAGARLFGGRGGGLAHEDLRARRGIAAAGRLEWTAHDQHACFGCSAALRNFEA